MIGAGHNGLVAAHYIVRAGWRPLVLEPNAEVRVPSVPMAAPCVCTRTPIVPSPATAPDKGFPWKREGRSGAAEAALAPGSVGSGGDPGDRGDLAQLAPVAGPRVAAILATEQVAVAAAGDHEVRIVAGDGQRP